MRNRSNQGFTLIELLIVIAIIGILAAVLIPNLLAARAAGQDRAAQAHSQQVFTALNAVLSEDINAVFLADAADGLNTISAGVGTDAPVDMTNPYNCAAGVTTYTSTGSGNYVVNNPGASVDACTIQHPTALLPLYIVVLSTNDAANNERCYVNGRAIPATGDDLSATCATLRGG